MPEKILGLDIGEDSIKAVQVTAGLREYHVIDSTMIDIEEAGGLDRAIEKLFENGTIRSNICITSLPVSRFSFRNIKLPFKNRKKIGQILPYEIEPLIPYPFDDVLIDYVITVPSEQPEALVASTLKSAVGDLVRLLAMHHVETSIIDIGSVPVALKLAADCDSDEYGLLLDIGKSETAGVLFTGTKIIQIRHFRFGGDDISDRIARTFGCDRNLAEERKKTGRVEGAREDIGTVYTRFFSDVENTLNFLMLNGAIDSMPSTIFLTGGGSHSPLLREEMERFFSIPVAVADLSATESIHMERKTAKSWDPAFMNQALALATRNVRDTDGFNFSRGDFRPKRKYDEFKKSFRWIALLFFFILCLFGIDLSLDYHYDTVYLKDLKKEITGVFRDTWPEVTRIVDPVQQARVKVEQLRNPFTGTKNSMGTGVLAILDDISRLIPTSVDFLITSFQYDGNTVTIKGQTDNFNTVDAIKKALDKSNILKNVKISSASLIKKENRVELDMKMDL
ncbi:MAG TPA: pilus assembly protein PilM [Syntrophales bacterium]|nr:pilus assembly protein PilM [Syntrophales bacterium]HPQ43907.1 pilus assembly protein PilM [Syntrophales bacterium]